MILLQNLVYLLFPSVTYTMATNRITTFMKMESTNVSLLDIIFNPIDDDVVLSRYTLPEKLQTFFRNQSMFINFTFKLTIRILKAILKHINSLFDLVPLQFFKNFSY